MSGRIQVGHMADKKKWRAVHNVKGVDIQGGAWPRKKDVTGDAIKGSYERRKVAQQLRAMKKAAKAPGGLSPDTKRYGGGVAKVAAAHASTMQRRWPAGNSNGGQFKPKG